MEMVNQIYPSNINHRYILKISSIGYICQSIHQAPPCNYGVDHVVSFFSEICKEAIELYKDTLSEE